MMSPMNAFDRGGTAIVDVDNSLASDGYLRNDLRMRAAGVADKLFPADVQGAIHPFPAVRKSVIPRDLISLWSHSRVKKTVLLMLINLLSTIMLFIWCHTTNSMALTAFVYLTVFDILSLLTSILSVWIKHQRTSARYSFGYERVEVLAVFTCTALAQLGSFFIFKESVERIFDQPEVHSGRIMVATVVALAVHLVATYGAVNAPFEHVISACHTSWLQEHVTDAFEGLCHYIPGLYARPGTSARANPLALLGGAATITLAAVYIAIDWRNYMAADTIAAMAIALFTCATMYPMSVYCGMILLQTTPTQAVGQLDKCVREACTLDGVLEFRNEHFWTLAFGKLAGSVHVRIRRDANEQLVLAHVASRLAPLVSVLTVQTFKDDWSRQPSQHVLQTTARLQVPPPAALLPDITPMKPTFKSRFDVSQDGGSSFLGLPATPALPGLAAVAAAPGGPTFAAAAATYSNQWTSTPVGTPLR